MDVSEFSDIEPRLDLFSYFQGHTRAWGLFNDRSGRVVRKFTVQIKGVVAGNELTLTEDFLYDDGQEQQRIWRIQRLSQGVYRGKAMDVIGVAKGRSSGGVFNWRYTLSLPYKGSVINVDFDDWMFLQPDGVLLNRAEVKKFGFRVGEVFLAFQKMDAA